MCIDASPLPLNIFHHHIPRPYMSMSDSIILTIRLTEVKQVFHHVGRHLIGDRVGFKRRLDLVSDS